MASARSLRVTVREPTVARPSEPLGVRISRGACRSSPADGGRRRGLVWAAMGWMAATLFALVGFRDAAPSAQPIGGSWTTPRSYGQS
ncbi:DUF4436 family protein [Streptomyces sp. NPDC050355]|uniref:DUF4436 family protein n=1 Tax=Streptomyces sp. NPDC050355 TaxID=3365609 RepID=UPI00379DAD76